MENPDDISKLVLAKGLDSGTAYKIISIDIADIDIGRNIGANLQAYKLRQIIRLHRPEQKSVGLWRLL